MSLDLDQQIALHLAGTIAMPSPQPAIGSIEILTTPRQNGTPGELHLQITHRVNHKLIIKRLVRLSEVRAICAPPGVFGNGSARRNGSSGTHGGDWEFKTASELQGLVREQSEKAKADGRLVQPWLAEAVAYVPESAPVLMQVEVGMTAAESAEYYPPLVSGYPGPIACDSEFCRPGYSDKVLGTSASQCR